MADQKNNLQEAIAYAKALERQKEILEGIEKGIGDISQATLGLSMSDFFEEIEKSDEEMKSLRTQFNKLSKELKTEGEKFGNQLSSRIIAGADGLSGKLGKEIQKAIDTGAIDEEIGDAFKNASGNAEEMAKVYARYAFELEKTVGLSSKMPDSVKKTASNYLKLQTATYQTKLELEQTNKHVFSMSKMFGNMAENMLKSFLPTIGDLKSSVMEMDATLSKSQRGSGIAFKENGDAMRLLATRTNEFGVNMAEAAEFMGGLGDALNTTDFNLLAKAADDTKAISLATGVSQQEVGKLTQNFMLAGKSSESVADFTRQAMKDSQKFGLNTKKVIEDVSKNYTLFRKLGFQGGEESLKKMVITAQRLRMNVDEIFNVAQKARSIEGAMEMAAELQLAGGSFAQIDPMQLLAAARKSPEELAKILGQMGKDIGKFDEKTGEVKFDPVDADRLAMVAQATGMTVEALQNQITKGKQRIAKEGKGLFEGFTGGLDDETKDIIDQFSTIGKNGKIELSGAFEGMNVEDLRKMGQSEIKQKIDEYNKNKATMEEQAKKNQSFTEALTNLKNSLVSVLSVFQPFINWLTILISKINSFSEKTKGFIAGFGLLLITFFGPAAAIAKGFLMGQGFNTAVQGGSMFRALTSGIKGMFGFGKGVGGIIKNARVPGQGSGMFSGMNATQILAVGKAAGAAAPGILALGAAIALVGVGIGAAAFGLSYLVDSFSKLTGPQAFGAVAAIAVVMGGFVAIIYAMTPAIGLLAGTATIAAAPLIALGAAFLMIGAGIGIAAFGISYLVDSISKLGPLITSISNGINLSMTGFGNLIANLAPLAPSLLLLGPAFLLAAAGLAAFTLAATAFGISSIVFGSAFEEKE